MSGKKRARAAHPRVMLGLILPACMLAQPSGPAPQSDAASPISGPLLLAPTQGRPAFVEPGGKLQVAALLPGPGEGLRFELVYRRHPQRRYSLDQPTSQAADTEKPELRLELAVPPTVPELTYDLEIRCGTGVLVGRHAVCVRRVGPRVRLVHLSNMNIGDLSAPTFDQRLVTEVNLLTPTLIIATGDLLDVTHNDPELGWQQLSEFLAGFDAPVLVACGDHDDPELYSRFMGPSPMGVMDLGPYRGLLLYDLPARPITGDPEQIQWAERTLMEPGHRLAFIVAHADCPNLLLYWAEQGVLRRMLQGGRVGIYLVGGSRDWDGQEYGEVLDAARPLLYLRTACSSCCTSDGASGISHYRLLDIEGYGVTLYGPRTTDGLVGSIPTGKLEIDLDGPNDGQQGRVEVTVVSRLPMRLDDLSVRVLLRREEGYLPWCHGARLRQVIAVGQLWECWLGFDLPDKGMLRAVVGSGPEPQEPDVAVRFEGPDKLSVRQTAAADGTMHQEATWPGVVVLENRGPEPAEVQPLVRLDGSPIAYRLLEEPGPFAAAYRLHLRPQQRVTLQLDLSVLRIEPGRRELQVYLKAGSAYLPACWPLDVTLSAEPGGDQAMPVSAAPAGRQ